MLLSKTPDVPNSYQVPSQKNDFTRFSKYSKSSPYLRMITTQLSDWRGFVFWVIMDPGYYRREKIHAFVKNKTETFKVISNPENLISYLQVCDSAICPIGSAPHEAEAISKIEKLGYHKFYSDSRSEILMEYLTVNKWQVVRR